MLPVLFEWNNFSIYSYPLFIGLSWGIAYHLSRFFLEKSGVSLTGFSGLYWGTFIFSWIGAKVFYLISSSGNELATYAGSSLFWLGGGFVFYGGLIFGTIFILIYTKLWHKFSLKKCYLLLPSLTIAHAVGRVGCLLAGCCFGKVCQLPWAIHLHGAYRHPVQLYETFSLLIIGATLIYLVNRKFRGYTITVVYFLGYSSVRFCLEFFRGDKIRGIHSFHLSTSQLISLGVILIILIIEALRRKRIILP